MKAKKIFLVMFVVLIFILLLVSFGLTQVKKEETIIYGGIIKSISIDCKSIIVNNENILVSSKTRIFNEAGKPLKIEDLKPELYVVVEGVENPNGLLARKIMVKKPPEV